MEATFEDLRAVEARLSNTCASVGLAAASDDELKTLMRLASAVKNAADRVLALGQRRFTNVHDVNSVLQVWRRPKGMSIRRA